MDFWRLAVLGDDSVGKTSLALNFTRIGWLDSGCYDPSLEESYRRQLIVDNRMCFVEVVAPSKPGSIVAIDQPIQESQGFAFVYSVTSRASYDKIQELYEAVRKVREDKPAFILVGNKCDIAAERQVSWEEGAETARILGCEFFEASVKTGYNVERLFMTLVRFLREPQEPEEPKVRTRKRSKSGGMMRGRDRWTVQCILM